MIQVAKTTYNSRSMWLAIIIIIVVIIVIILLRQNAAYKIYKLQTHKEEYEVIETKPNSS